MAKQLQVQREKGQDSYTIKFWCLEKHKLFYQKQFAEEGIDIVEVCSIEDLLKKEQDGELADRAKFVRDFMNTTSLNEVTERVKLKDLLSLFLLASQGGYFFDTNVSPEKGKTVSLPGEPTVTTAKSGFQNSNDFYMMYSPKRADSNMLAIFDAWKEDPGFGNLSVFRAPQEPVPYFAKEMGVKKQSYKSYYTNNGGLFYWLQRTHNSGELDVFEENIKYGDVNHQQAYSQNMKELENFSLCYLDDPVTTETLLAIPFKTNTAYVSTKDWKMYYVDKKANTAVLVYDGCSTLFDIFPGKYHSSKIELANEGKLLKIIASLEKPISGHPRLISNETNYHPPYIINKENCTLLHQAVLTKNIEQVKSLLKAGARLDLKATYEIKPEGKILEVTAKELADYLGHTEIANLLQSNLVHSGPKSELPVKEAVKGDLLVFKKIPTEPVETKEEDHKLGEGPP
ncbi:hypothetical protein [Legionella lansingensis]|nr:hypothetical protein [Legionella lansingensis]